MSITMNIITVSATLGIIADHFASVSVQAILFALFSVSILVEVFFCVLLFIQGATYICVVIKKHSEETGLPKSAIARLLWNEWRGR